MDTTSSCRPASALTLAVTYTNTSAPSTSSVTIAQIRNVMEHTPSGMSHTGWPYGSAVIRLEPVATNPAREDSIAISGRASHSDDAHPYTRGCHAESHFGSSAALRIGCYCWRTNEDNGQVDLR